MIRYISILLISLPIFIFPQDGAGEKIFLQYLEADAIWVGLYPTIHVADINNDGTPETFILIADTLNVIKDDVVTKYCAFNLLCGNIQNLSSLIYKPNENESGKFYSIGYNLQNYEWSSYEPDLNTWNFGTLNEPIDYSSSFAADPLNNIWVSYNDIEMDGKIGILKMTEFTSLADTVTYIGNGDSLFKVSDGFLGITQTYFSRDGQYISIVQSGDHIFTSGNPSGLYYYYSSDYGSTWQGKDIARGSFSNPVFGQVINRNLAPFFVMVTSYSGVIDDNGILHFAIYGYGLTPDVTDTLRTTSILYWNSRDENWIAITDPVFESDRDAFGNILGQYSPGFAHGQSLPSISITNDGSIVLVSWTSQEYEGDPLTSPYNIYPGDGGPNSTPVYYTDVLANVSFDGGKTWNVENIFPLEHEKSYSENSVTLNPYILSTPNNNLKVDYFYLVDSIPGWTGNAQNSLTFNKLYYNTYTISVTGNNSELAGLFDFKLEQNFPNPFNPSTKIRWEIPLQNRAIIKIFNILGEEISTLVDEEMAAGKYEILFNGSNLASGVYFYQLRSGNYIKTKKMMLLK
jgi:Secretion system C-terminal sorting domain